MVEDADVVFDDDHVADGAVGANADVAADGGGVDVGVGPDVDEVGDAEGEVGEGWWGGGGQGAGRGVGDVGLF